MSPAARAILVIAAGTLAACASEPETARVQVVVHTDYVPGREFDEIWLERLAPIGDDVPGFVEPDIDFVDTGHRFRPVTVPLAEIELRVGLRGPELEVLRPVTVDATQTTQATIAIPRNCTGLCPMEACLGGACMSPTCIAERPDACSERECTHDGECPAPDTPCAVARCLAGACLLASDDDRCRFGERCEPRYGCRPSAEARLSSRISFERTDLINASSSASGECTSCPDPSGGAGHRFDGVDDCVRQSYVLDFATAPGGVTMSIWVRPARLEGTESQAIFVRRHGGSARSTLGLWLRPGLDGSTLTLEALGELPVMLEGPSLAPDVWTLLAATWDGQHVALWVDGEQVAEGPLPELLVDEDVTTIGCELRAVEETSFFEGRVLDARIWRRALYDGELRELFDETRPDYG